MNNTHPFKEAVANFASHCDIILNQRRPSDEQEIKNIQNALLRLWGIVERLHIAINDNREKYVANMDDIRLRPAEKQAIDASEAILKLVSDSRFEEKQHLLPDLKKLLELCHDIAERTAITDQERDQMAVWFRWGQREELPRTARDENTPPDLEK